MAVWPVFDCSKEAINAFDCFSQGNSAFEKSARHILYISTQLKASEKLHEIII